MNGKNKSHYTINFLFFFSESYENYLNDLKRMFIYCIQIVKCLKSPTANNH